MSAGTPNRWALLIGINFYLLDKSLEGCVNDVEATRQLLESGQEPVDIVALTASTPSDSTSKVPPEDPGQWPTRSNIFGGLRRIIAEAQPGDHVYIHYSGHGARIRGDSPSMSVLALVLFEVNGCSYFRGQQLGNCLNKMVEKGLLVSVVLDCCYCGDIVRGGGIAGLQARATEYRPEADTLPAEDLWGEPESFRDAVWRPAEWLVNPQGYSILSAAGPHEEAQEIQLRSGLKRGALSYFLNDALGDLRQRQSRITHHSLYQHIRTRFHVSWPRQVPMRYGNQMSTFFNNMLATNEEDFVSAYRDGQDICIAAGEAHGVSVDDEYTAIPYNAAPDSEPVDAAELVKLRVIAVRPLTSVVVEADGSTTTITATGTTCKARPVKRFLPHKFRIGIIDSLEDDQLGWCKAVDEQEYFSFVPQTPGMEPCIFNLRGNQEQKAYEIVDALNEAVPHVPLVSFDKEGSRQAALDLLRHLASFKQFEGLENRKPSRAFEDSFSVKCTPDVLPEGWVHVPHEGTWGFEIENRSDKPLYMSIFCMNASWGIVNLVADGAGTEFIVVPPRNEYGPGREDLSLSMNIPKAILDRGYAECEDLIKLFITSQPTSFPSVILPKLEFGVQDPGDTSRGPGSDRISAVIQELNARYRNNSLPSTAEEWATRTIIIKISKAL